MLQGMNSLPRARMMNQLNREVGAGDYRPELSNSYAGNIPWSNELDNLTLLQRRSLLLKSKLQSCPHHLTSDAAVKEGKEESPPFMDALAIKHDDKHIDSQRPDCCPDAEPLEVPNHVWFQVPGFMCSSSSQQDASSTKKYAPDFTNIGNISDPLDSTKVKVEPYDENHLLSHQKTALSGSDAVSTEQNGKVQDDDGWCNQLDHVPLINRREMLLVSKQLLCMNGTYSCISRGCEVPSVIHHSPSVKEEEGHCDSLGTGENLADLIASSVNEVIHPISENFKTGNELHPPGERHDADTCRSSVIAKSGVNLEVQTSDVISSSKRKSSKLKRCIRSDHMPLNKRSFPKSTLGTAVKVKIEPSDHTEVLDSKHVAVGNFTFNSLSVKREMEVQNHLFEDNLDHMLLRERMNMLTSRADSGSECDWLATTLPASEKISAALESVKPIKIKHPRKRRKTVTDSVETALEEDAPGLLRVLLDNGVSVDELKLYGDIEDDDTLSDFAELEEVISKLFSQRQMHLKFGPLRSGKDTRTTYCLACLFSLVEQTRYLQFRKWPVEWGWCRDLQSFIFVFERHKRIVLERPEYGYATYFFELVDSLPIVWQIKRLVIAMKLTSCSRVSLIENKALRMRAICARGEKRLRSRLRRPEAVGQDLTEGEARVLMEYGWRPSSGLGTMLNYCDRVVHDRKNEIEKDTSEWRAKIGKLLMDGYSGGAIISRGILKKVIEYKNPERAEVKLEL